MALLISIVALLLFFHGVAAASLERPPVKNRWAIDRCYVLVVFSHPGRIDFRCF